MPFSHDSNSQSKCIYLKCKVQKNTIDNDYCSWKDNYTISTIHYALFGVYCHSTVLGKKGKTTRDVYGAAAFAFQVNGLQIAADPFQPARVSTQGAQNGAAEQRFEDAGNNDGHNYDKKP